MDLKQADSYKRRIYTLEGESLDNARRIELLVKVDGKKLVHVQAREPGILAFVSKPDDQGFEIHVVEVGGSSFQDVAGPGDDTLAEILDWQVSAMDLIP